MQKPGLSFRVLLPDTTTATQIYVVGEMNNWKLDNVWVLNVTDVDGKKYAIGEYDLPEASITGGVEFRYKYLIGKSWDNVEMKKDGSSDIKNRFVYVNENLRNIVNDAVLNWKGEDLVNPATSTITVKFIAYVPDTTPDGSVVQLVGDMNGWNGEDMVKEGNVWTITKQLESNTYYEFKLRLKNESNAWAYPEGNETGGYEDNRALILNDDATIVILKVHSWENM
ncbi:hypothetical protein [Thermosipho sp. 1070]|uniref:hypothetical protein n=1 Tax=Thermosipho sp. 1070 TaxID=1437364 RepID=UPI0009494286|nr:hypothetical protein [Thermosipho sp. 1070]ANQ54593.1 hypothetical protein Y592_03650 [Thermosipho sp. 1070]